ncbi:N-acetylmuramoyl-L-alanine amidase-like [Chanos chanos]|uniref:N-acetylmuramoyl-L-alanine amidase-like n=1 Tax=Chanos chanos TaxID=29144 RepID=A0A6J2WZQ5_CHACN|nr:N-acetylmuramoyl-L-alanine amidase-like [Chanos chanos]
MESHWKLFLTLVVVAVSCYAEASIPKHMNNFIEVVEKFETENPELDPVAVVKALRRVAGLESPFIQRYLGVPTANFTLDSKLSSYIMTAMAHEVTDGGVENGVVFTQDGTTVALSPLLLGIEAGLQSTTPEHVEGIYPLTLGNTLALSFLYHNSRSSETQLLGTRGCWNHVASPEVYTLSDQPSLATDAMINGGIDGLILGLEIASPNSRPQKLSELLRSYYTHRLDERGLDGAPRLISQMRRTNFKDLLSVSLLKTQVKGSMARYGELHGEKAQENFDALVNTGIEEFIHTYATCPNIIARCTWGAKPFIGSPSYLSLPVSYVILHHTASPSQPCTSFDACAANMRSMQSYHQNTNGWSDIGYNFVAGGDGNMYEGRGWKWVGAHAYGWNSKSLGVSIIGDYTSRLPSSSTINMVRYQFSDCAKSGGRASYSYILYGHRQVDSTSCPGNSLFNEMKKWEHFRVREKVM